MTLEETKKVLMTANALFPQWKVQNPTETTRAWHWALEEYPAELVMAALQIFVKTSNSAFAPSPSELIECMHKAKENEQLSEGEAWYLVKKAIQGANYHAEENFEKLPPTIQQAIGGASMLRQWGMTDSEEVNTVVMSNFQRAYRTVVEREKFSEKIPEQLRTLINGLTEKTSGTKALESKSRYVCEIEYLDKRDNVAKVYTADTDDVGEALRELARDEKIDSDEYKILNINNNRSIE